MGSDLPSTPDAPVQTFALSEEQVALRVGLQRREVSARRGPEGARWAFGPNRRVLWSTAGVADLERELAPDSEPAKTAPPVASVETLTVRASRFTNRRVVLAYRENPDERLTVYLGANGNSQCFVPGMKILARLREGALWDFEGNPDAPERGRRMPRFPGRW